MQADEELRDERGDARARIRRLLQRRSEDVLLGDRRAAPLVFLVSGLPMWFPATFGRVAVAIGYVLHDIAALVMLVGFIVHIYEGTAQQPGTFQAMTRGTRREAMGVDASPGVVSASDRSRSARGLRARARPWDVTTGGVIAVRGLAAGLTCALAAVTLAHGEPQTKSDGNGAVRLRNVAVAAGLTFTHNYSAAGGKYFVESAPGGLAVFDYNGDGRPDIFFTNGAPTPSLDKTVADATANRLYRNDGGMRFTDVTDAAGVRGVGYAMGAAAADYDNDGHVDLFVAGRTAATSCCATAATARSRTSRRRRASRAATGRSRAAGSTTTTTAGSISSSSTTCSGRRRRTVLRRPGARRPRSTAIRESSRGCRTALYRNRGDGTFEDVSARAGIAGARRQGDERRVRRLRPRRASWTCSSPTTPCRTSCSTTRATARSRKSALLAGVSVPRIGPARLEHGRRLPGLRQRRLGGHPRHRAGRRDVPALPQRRARRIRRDDARRAGSARLTVEAVGLVRGRWPTSTTTAGRTSSPPTRTPTIASAISRRSRSKQANSLFVERRQRTFPRRDARRPDSAAPSPRTAAAASPTSTATAVSTSSSSSLGEPAELWQNESALGQPLADRAARRHARAIATASARESPSAIRCGR